MLHLFIFTTASRFNMTAKEFHKEILTFFSLDGPFRATQYESLRNTLVQKTNETQAEIYLSALCSPGGQDWPIPSTVERNVFVYSVVDFFIGCGLDIWKIAYTLLMKRDLTEFDRAGILQFLPVNLSTKAVEAIRFSVENVNTIVLAETLADLFEDWAKPELLPIVKPLIKQWEFKFPSEAQRIEETVSKLS